MPRDDPVVSVVIPTIGRPLLVPRAVHSALAQSLRAVEVIVVVDGPDDATERALRQIDDPRMRVVGLPENVGLGEARKAGIRDAQGRWIALLDDDDEWLPSKLDHQLRAAQQSSHASPIVSCRFIDRRPHGDVVLPSRFPATGEALSEYLFCRRRLLSGEGVVLPSTMLTAKDLAARVPFRYAQFAHEGSDWLLRAARCDGVGLEFVPMPEPLVIRHAETTHDRMSATADWRKSFQWVEDNAGLLTSRARASFMLTRTSLEARRARKGSAFWLLVWESFRRGKPTLTSILAHVLIWLVPERARFKIIAFFHSRLRKRSH
jgi:glycosyltransferase involved in cell wall biosynthesis